MAETLLVYQTHIAGPDGALYEARAVGDDMPSGGWQGWIEFLPLAGGPPVRTSRETTQPNRTDTEYWATGLTPVYLEGALNRALALPPPPCPRTIHPPSWRAGLHAGALGHGPPLRAGALVRGRPVGAGGVPREARSP